MLQACAARRSRTCAGSHMAPRSGPPAAASSTKNGLARDFQHMPAGEPCPRLSIVLSRRPTAPPRFFCGAAAGPLTSVDRTRRPAHRDFVRSDAGEPHLRNRVTLLARYPEIAKLFGHDVRTVYVTLAVVAAQFAVAAGFQSLSIRRSLFGSWWSVAIVACAFGAFLNHWGGVVSHEAPHNLCARTPTANRWVAILANLPIGVPSAMSFRRHHLDHHRYLGIPGLDNDLPTRFEVDFLGRTGLGKVCWVLAYPFFGTLPRGYLRRPRGREVTGVLAPMAV